MAVQVVNATGNVQWTTDKVKFSTSTSNVTFQVSVTQLTYVNAQGQVANATMTTPTGNLYANAIQLPFNSTQTYYVGAGNYLNILTGSNFTAEAIGTASSATAGITGV